MKKYFQWGFIASLFFLNACTNGSSSINANAGNSQLSAQEFSNKLQQTPNAIVVDVRTPEEFERGHIQNAKNIDINGDNFENEISQLDKSKPVFVYCLSGGRSEAAAEKMASDGFKQVYELQGGILTWRAAGLPETTDNNVATVASAPSGMTTDQFNALLNSDKLVLIDFYADWCGPCKLMKPAIEEIKSKMNDKVQVVSINADENQSLLSSLGVDALPTLLVYKNKAMIWKNIGYTEKANILQHLQ